MSWCNRNPVGTRCEVLIGEDWRVGYIGGFSPEHIRIRVAGRRDVVLDLDERERYRVWDYEAGLRRAQELASDVAQTDSCDISVFLDAFVRAIDAEAEKERE